MMKKAAAVFSVLVLLLAVSTTVFAAGFQYADQLKGTELQIFSAIEQNITDKVETFDIKFSSPISFDDEAHAKLGVREAVLRAYEAFYRDHPEVFWVTKEGGITVEPTTEVSGTKISVTGTKVTTVFFDANVIDDKKNELESAVSSILSKATGSDYDKVKLFHDEIIEKCSYDNAARSKPNKYPDSYETYGALVNGKAVCEGYAKSLKLLCDREGIPCVLVGGIANGGEHMWNYVMIGGMWYLVDATFDDPIGGEPNDRYLLKGSDSTSADHRPEGGFIEQFDSKFVDPSLAKEDYVPGKSPSKSTSSAGSESERQPFSTITYDSSVGGRCFVTFTGIGEAVDNGQQVTTGITVSIWAQPANGYQVKEITVAMGDETITESEKDRLQLIVQNDCAIHAAFEPA